ncbi:MAG TPA: MFS transporter [Gammaproteobacteria bacterium]|nr:MFS transporter [Gammaproteobacteria bacterium]|tara:strand:+ start:1597 stop:2862 length:1266 start_codon:yes stop_codon:yes gene_type:complete
MHQRYLLIFSLVLVGEAIFSLPFHVARFFRPSFLEVFNFSNADLGDVFAVYGVTAMLAYFPGGMLADRFSARKLLTFSLIATAAGGLYMASIPGILGMSVLFAYWGVTSILLLWAALIRTTREWGGSLSQGRAFGILDGGRGLLAAGLASIAVVLFSAALGVESTVGNHENQINALVTVIYFYTATTFIAGIIAWFFIPNSQSVGKSDPSTNVVAVLRQPIVWAQALIVVCAYCGYKGLDNYALYAVDVLGMSEVDAAAFTAASAYLRPIAAIAAGFAADRYRASTLIAFLFLILIASYGFLGLESPESKGTKILFANIFLTFAGVYGFRGVYFALLQETQVPSRVTGTAVGLISLIGFTPDVFFAAVGGRLLDNAPGLVGHQHYFLLLSSIMAVGVFATATLIHLVKRQTQALSESKSGL